VLWGVVAGGLLTTAARLIRLRRTVASRAARRDLLVETLIDVPTDLVVEEEMLDAVGR
jgi:hypothetical protein